MTELLLIITGVCILAVTWIAYQRTSDPLCPAIIFAPMLLYVYVYHPYGLIQSGALLKLFPNLDNLVPVLVYNILGLTAFCWGAAWERSPRNSRLESVRSLRIELPRAMRQRLFRIGMMLGILALGGFWFMVWYSGGFWNVFGRGGKPFLRNPSGYVGELPTLVFPSLLLLAVAIQGSRLKLSHVVTALLIASPQLIMASFGGRRGPAFLVLACLGVSWAIVRMRRPNWRLVMAATCALGLLILFLGSNRRNLYLGSQQQVDFDAFAQRITSSEATTGDEFVCGSAIILTAQEHTRHYWGRRLLTLFLIRPIPRQLWPDKYVDMGLSWMQERPGSGGFSNVDWIRSVGFVPAGGSAGGFLSDLFLEFSWFGILGAFLVGRLYSAVWARWITRGGVWSVLYLEMLVVSIYLPAQSIGACGYRLLLLAAPTWFAWAGIRRRMRRKSPSEIAGRRRNYDPSDSPLQPDRVTGHFR